MRLFSRVKIFQKTIYLSHLSRIELISYDHYKKVNSYPVYVRNLSNETITIGYGNQIRLIGEIKGQNNNWYAIERPHYYACGTGIHDINLYKNELAITGVPVIKGDTNIEFRVKIGKVASNSINLKLDSTYVKELRERIETWQD